jgi:hypothetical protein
MHYLGGITYQGIAIKPRWPYKKVAVSYNAFEALKKAQNQLSQHEICLVLTRGYEYEGPLLKKLHKIIRIISAALFCFVYPYRYHERGEIFSANGHNK